MPKIAASIVAFAAFAGMAQDYSPGGRLVVPSTSSTAALLWDKGAVESGIYKNASIGLEITPAPGLQFEAPELDGNVGAVPLVVTITAASAPKLSSIREVMAFYSDALTYYPEGQRSTDAYLRKVIQANQGQGWEPLKASFKPLLFGGETFVRQDFRRGLVYEAALVRSCEAQAIVFYFAASNRNRVNKLIAATQLKLNPAHSGCGSKVSSAK